MDPSTAPMRFTGTPIVLKQPLLVALSVAFTVGLLVAAFGPWGGGPVEEPSDEPMSIVAWLFWLLVLAALAVFASLLCYGVEVTVDAAGRRVTESHRVLRHELKKTEWRFEDFTAITVTLKLNTEHRGESSPTGGATLATARTVNVRSWQLSLQRPEMVLHTTQGRLTAPHRALNLPMDDQAGDRLAVEAAARSLAQLGGWPAQRRHYRQQADGSVKVQADAMEPISA